MTVKYANVYPSFVRDEIENWIAWCWAGESPEPREPDRCYSAERSYRVLNTNSEEKDVEIPPKVAFNSERAVRVQQVFDRMPQLTRRVLQFEYTHRSRYDLWERNVEMYEGQMRPVWVRTDNNRRHRARIELGIGRDEYLKYLDEFKIGVFKEFEADEVCA